MSLLLQAARMALSRARPPLAACARVWALRQGPLGRLEGGTWASLHHMAAAAKERTFWSKVEKRICCGWWGGIKFDLWDSCPCVVSPGHTDAVGALVR
jgi:hypothetical protein